ncbi:hypothetical protein LPJ53_005529 [Coemansia erecta]|uniref:Uncharacterized protein n=1 Tax=Coemansia erecta TaxID=147472 RepID=A0A9W7XUU6_9FUNG|nr:hypothetical protein LPJ53_005529 [Coemansia erecta]
MSESGCRCKGITKPVSSDKVKGKTASQMAEDASPLFADDIHEHWRKRVSSEKEDEKEKGDDEKKYHFKVEHDAKWVAAHGEMCDARTTEYKDLPRSLKYKVDTLAQVAIRTLLRKSDTEPSALLFECMFNPTMNTDTSGGLYLCGENDSEKMDRCREVVEMARKRVPESFVGSGHYV